MNRRAAKLQADCDHVDATERAVSRLVFALQDMGWQWKTGRVGPVSEYGQTYARWCNGETREGHGAPMMESRDECVDAAIAMFRGLWDSGERFIVWRVFLDLAQHPDNGKWRLYMRWHTMCEAPADYLAKVAV